MHSGLQTNHTESVESSLRCPLHCAQWQASILSSIDTVICSNS